MDCLFHNLDVSCTLQVVHIKLGLEDFPSTSLVIIIIIDDPFGPFQPGPFYDHKT